MIEVRSSHIRRLIQSDEYATSAIRKATSWYNAHISLAHPPVRGQTNVLPTVVLLSDDAANRQKAESEGLRCLSGKLTCV